MKIAIDCRSLRKKPAGVPNFLLGVINHLAIHKQDWTIYLLSNTDFSEEVKSKLRTAPNIIKVIEPSRLFPKIATLWYLLKASAIVRALKVDLFYSPIPNLPFNLPRDIKTMITVHDMVYRRYPKTMSAGNRLINFFLHDFSIKTADKLWAVSNYTKGEIEALYPQRKCRTIEIGTSIDKSIFHPVQIDNRERLAMLDRYNIRDRFILTVGTLEPRKNLRFLISLMGELAAENLELLVVGAKGWGHASANDFDLPNAKGDQIRFAGFVSDQDLVKLYQLAAVYVSTSLNEGFCLPLLEAMQCGCPIVAAHNSGMIEVAADGGQTITGWDKGAWISAIKESIKNRSKYVSSGFNKAKTYDWKEVIIRITDFIGKV